MARRALDEALHRAVARKQFGKEIGEFQQIQAYLADSVAELDAARLLVFRAALLKDEGAPSITEEAAVAKMYATVAARESSIAACRLRRARCRAALPSSACTVKSARPHLRGTTETSGGDRDATARARATTPVEERGEVAMPSAAERSGTLPVMRAPSLAEIAASRLFSPCTLASGLRLNERTWVPAMVPWRATDDGFVTSAVLDWYARFAEGEPGAIVVEATGIRDVPSGPLLRIGHDRFLPGLRTLVERVRQRSGGRTRLFIQCIDFLQIKRRPPKDKFILRFLRVTDALRRRLAALLSEPALEAASEQDVRGRLVTLSDETLRGILDHRDARRWIWPRERVTDVEHAHIRDLPHVLRGSSQSRRAGARRRLRRHESITRTPTRCRSFRTQHAHRRLWRPREQRALPLRSSRRAQARGSPLYGRMPFPLRRDHSGSGVDDAAFWRRWRAQGWTSCRFHRRPEDAKQTKVGEAAYPYTGPSGHECMPTALGDEKGPFGRNVPKQAQVRKAVRAAGLETPVVVAGGICSFDQAEAILAGGAGDLIGAARQSLADPDWFKKLRLGYGQEVRACTYTNYCEALDQRHRAVTCKLWDHADLDEMGAPILFEEGKSRRRLIAPPWRRS
jgi:2,4-dienoyl-CoA reductase-like NADH-dependent reductase (Old Yellow Enzyme family)